MDRKLILCFSHRLTPEQERSARNGGITQFLTLPEELQSRCEGVPPQADLDLQQYLKPLFRWLEEVVAPDDLILVQGDYGAVYRTVRFCKARHWTAIYATTERRMESRSQGDGSVVIRRHFRHVAFRKY